jgi:hypothetical protein
LSARAKNEIQGIENGANVVETKWFGEQKNMILTMLDMIREDIAGRPITLAILQTAAEVSIIESLRAVLQTEFKCVDIVDAYYRPSVSIWGPSPPASPITNIPCAPDTLRPPSLVTMSSTPSCSCSSIQ